LFCDRDSRLYVPNPNQDVQIKSLSQQKIQNAKLDTNPTNLVQEQIDDIERASEKYDCGVWQHLRSYQSQGLVRVLYPSQQLFSTCHPDRDDDIPFRTLLIQIKDIVSGFLLHNMKSILKTVLHSVTRNRQLNNPGNKQERGEENDNSRERLQQRGNLN